MNVKEHWTVKIKDEDRPRAIVITKIDNGWIYMKDLPGTPEGLIRGRFSERITDVEFVSLLKA